METEVELGARQNEFHAAVQVGVNDVEVLESVVGSRLKNMELAPENIIDAVVSMCTRNYSEGLTGRAIKILSPYATENGYASYSDVEPSQRKRYLAVVRSAFFTFATECAALLAKAQPTPAPFLWNPCTTKCLEQWKAIFVQGSEQDLVNTVASIIHPVYMLHYGNNYDTAEYVFGGDAMSIEKSIAYPIIMIVMCYMRPCAYLLRRYGQDRCADMITNEDFTYPNLDLVPFTPEEAKLVTDLPAVKLSIPATMSDLFLLYGAYDASEFLSSESTRSRAKEFAIYVFSNLGNLGLLYLDFCSALCNEEASMDSGENPDFTVLRNLFVSENDGFATLGAITANSEPPAEVGEVPVRDANRKRKDRPPASVSFGDISTRRTWEIAEPEIANHATEDIVSGPKRVKIDHIDKEVPTAQPETIMSNPEKCAIRFSGYLERCRSALAEFNKIVQYHTAANKTAEMDNMFASSIEKFEELWRLAGAWKYKSAKWLHQTLPVENKDTSSIYATITPLREDIIEDVCTVNVLESCLQTEAVGFAQMAKKIQILPSLLLKHALGVFYLLLKASKETRASLIAKHNAADEDSQGRPVAPSDDIVTFKLDRWEAFRRALQKHHILGHCYTFNMEVQSALFQCSRMAGNGLL